MYLVCDGGGTKTEYLLFDRTGRVHGRSKGEGTNALFVNPAAAGEAVCRGIRDCLSQSDLHSENLTDIVLFIPGFGEALALVKEQFPDVQILLLGDEYNAYYGALGQPGGIAILAGTGSFAVGKTCAGQWVKAGGWGPLFGDKGSGYDIGIMCLEAVTQLYDRGICDTVLQRNTLCYLGLADIAAIRKAAYQPDFTRARIAGLSYVVADAARQGDPDADQILERTVNELAKLADTLSRHVDSDTEVSLLGGLTGMGELLTGKFRKALEELLPQCRYREPLYTPIVGAALYVMYELENAAFLPPMFTENLMREMEE